MVSLVGFDINGGNAHYVIEALHVKSLQRNAKIFNMHVDIITYEFSMDN